METGFPAVRELVTPICLIAGAFLVGYIFEKIVLARLKRLAEKTKWEGDDAIISALRVKTYLLFLIAGIYAAIQFVPMTAGLLNFIEKVLVVGAILAVTLIMMKLLSGFVSLYAKQIKGVLPATGIFANLTGILVFAIGILIVLNTLGISITPLLTALGIGGLAVALALQDTLSNLFSGLNIAVSKQVRPGDYVKLQTGEEGYVTDITWRTTTIRMLANNIVVVPNSKLASAILTNYYLPEKDMAVLVNVGVSYDSDLQKVEKVTVEVGKEVMREVQGGVPEFEPFIRYNAFSDFSIDFTVILRGKEFVDQYLIKHEFIKRLHKRYEKEGIEIPFPIRTVHLEQDESRGKGKI
jgi:small-conductance mechanosensitive channel